MQKKSYALSLLAAGCAAGVASSAKASTLIYEPFNSSGQTAGAAISGTNPTTPPAGVWYDGGTVGATVHQIASPGLTSPMGFPASAGNMADMKNADTTDLERLSIPNAFDTNSHAIYAGGSSLFYSLLLDVPSTAGLGTAANHTNPNENNDLLVGLNNAQGSQASRPNSWNGELVIRQGSAGSTFNLGIRGSTTTASTTYFTGDLTPGTTYLIVVEALINSADTDGTNSIWVNPASATFGAATPPTADGSSNGLGSAAGSWNMESLLIGSGTATGSAPTDTYLDEIRLGNTWADVTSVPEPTSIALVGLGALGLLNRRRRIA